MKKTIFALGLGVLCGLGEMKAQIQQDTALVTNKNKYGLQVDKLYAGLYGITSIDSAALESGNADKFANIRIGGSASRNMNRFVAKALLAYDKTVGEKEKRLGTFGLSYQPCKATTFDIGSIPMAATHMVALPVTAGGHFLFTAETKVPGPGLAVKATQKLGDVTVVGSATQTDAGVKPSMYVSIDNKTVGSIAAAGVYTPDTREFAGGVSWNKQFRNQSSIFAILWGSPHNLALSSMFTTKNNIGIFVDGSYDLDTHTIPAAQAGVIKALDGPVNAKLGAGYDPINKRFQGVLFLNISR